MIDQKQLLLSGCILNDHSFLDLCNIVTYVFYIVPKCIGLMQSIARLNSKD